MTRNIQYNSSSVSAGDCIGMAWESMKPNYWLFFGMSLLALILTACIPCVNIFIYGPVMLGIYIAFLSQFRGQLVEFGTLFKGFEKFVPAMVIGIIEMIPAIISEGIRFSLNISDLISDKPEGDQFLQSYPEFALTGTIVIIAVIVFVVFIVFGLAWRVTFVFAVPLLSEHNLSIGEAISLSARAGWANAGGLILLFILQGLIAIGGVLLLCFGIFFVLPIIYGSTAAAYRQVFPDNHPPVRNEPPPPTAYGGSFGVGQ